MHVFNDFASFWTKRLNPVITWNQFAAEYKLGRASVCKIFYFNLVEIRKTFNLNKILPFNHINSNKKLAQIFKILSLSLSEQENVLQLFRFLFVSLFKQTFISSGQYWKWYWWMNADIVHMLGQRIKIKKIIEDTELNGTFLESWSFTFENLFLNVFLQMSILRIKVNSKKVFCCLRKTNSFHQEIVFPINNFPFSGGNCIFLLGKCFPSWCCILPFELIMQI